MRQGDLHKWLFAVLLAWILLPTAAIVAQQDSREAVDEASGEVSSEPPKIKIVYFTSSSCDDCLNVKKAMPDLIAGFEDYLTIEKYDIDDTSGESLAQLFFYLDKYNLGDIAPPVMFIGETSLIGDKQIIEKLQETIFGNMVDEPVSETVQDDSETDVADDEKPGDIQQTENQPDQADPIEDTDSLPEKAVEVPKILPEVDNTTDIERVPAKDAEIPAVSTPASPPNTAEEKVLEQFNKFSIGAIAVAGLLDGVNPCAFTTIVFFISMLTYLGKSKRQILIVGIGFTFAIFVTYLLLGLGLFGAVKSFFVTQGITKFVTRIVAVLTFMLAGWSFLDLIKYIRTKNTQSMTLGLPKSVKAKIHNVIRVGMGTRGLLTGALGVGVLVALLESVCTGQIYLPVIIFVAKSSTVRLDAVGYLLLYNLMFIVPLIVIFIITYYGVSSQSLGNFLGRHIILAKLTMALVFVGLGLMLLLV